MSVGPICNFCQYSERRILWKGNVEQKIYKCNNCGLICVYPQPTQDELINLYSQSYFDDNYAAISEARLKIFRDRLDRINKQYENKGRLLDIGCGIGLFLKVAQENGWNAVGIEPSKYAVEYARKEFGVEVFHGTLDSVTFEKYSFHLITMWDVLCSLVDPLKALRQTYDLLKINGLLVIKVPNRPKIHFVLSSILSKISPTQGMGFLHLPYQMYHFTPKVLRNILEKVGYDVIELEMTEEVKVKWHERSQSLIKSALKHLYINLLAAAGIHESFVIIGVKPKC